MCPHSNMMYGHILENGAQQQEQAREPRWGEAAPDERMDQNDGEVEGEIQQDEEEPEEEAPREEERNE